MKRISALLLATTLLLSPMPLMTGCGSLGSTVYKTEGVTIPTVDAAMQAWKDWVVAGHATQGQVDAVKVAYQEYYGAQQMAQLALKAWLEAKDKDADTATKAAADQNLKATFSSLDARTAGLIDLVSSFKKGTK